MTARFARRNVWCQSSRTRRRPLCKILLITIAFFALLFPLFFYYNVYLYVRHHNARVGLSIDASNRAKPLWPRVSYSPSGPTTVAGEHSHGVPRKRVEKSQTSTFRAAGTGPIEKQVESATGSRPSEDAVAKYIAAHPQLNKTEAYAMFYKRRNRRVNPWNTSFLLTAPNVCDINTQMIVLVHTAHSRADRRTAIRRTWGSVSRTQSWPNLNVSLRTRVAFIIGTSTLVNDQKIANESDHYGDIVQGGFVDSYRNMSIKSLLGLRWVDMYCPSSKYFIKSDDDMFVNIPKIAVKLVELRPTWSIIGPHAGGSTVYRTGKWAIPRTVFPFRRYPAYEAGAAYVITSDLLRPLYETAEFVPMFHVDDVYITGVIGYILNVTHPQVKGFAMKMTKKPKFCEYVLGQQMTSHGHNPGQLQEIWQRLEKGRSVC